jgi:hypothetical protein
VNAIETILVFALVPLAIYAAVSALTLRSKATAPRYRPGQPWEFAPVWWSANPEGVGRPAGGEQSPADGTEARTARGGARGSW